MSALGYDLAAIGLLWRRELFRLPRHPLRLLVGLGVPLVAWLLLRTGAAATLTSTVDSIDPTATAVGSFVTFFSGSILLAMLLAMILPATFAAVGIIEDRRNGWLTFVDSGPASRASLVAGQCVGVATVVCAQLALFLVLAPLVGYSLVVIDPLLLAAVCVLGSIALAALVVGIAWVLRAR